MNVAQKIPRTRVNITLPRPTLKLIDRVSERGGRSSLINEAVRFYITKMGRARLQRQLRQGAIERAERDQNLAAEWFALEE